MSITASTTQLPAGTWQADTVHSSVTFALRHNKISTFRGQFREFATTLTVAPDGEAELTGTVEADSVAIEDEVLKSHLTAPDFFDTERHPEINFHSSAVRRDADGVRVEGQLTIKGISRPVVAEGRVSDVIEDPFKGTRIALELETVIDRRDYGLGWNMAMPDGGDYLANEVALTIVLELTRSAPEA